jgi:hypothetical protein
MQCLGTRTTSQCGRAERVPRRDEPPMTSGPWLPLDFPVQTPWPQGPEEDGRRMAWNLC